MKLLENVPHLEIIELVLVHCITVYNDYHHSSRVLYKFVSNKSSDQLQYISPKKFLFLKFFNSEVLYTEVWFTDQNCKRIDRKDEVKISLVIP